MPSATASDAPASNVEDQLDALFAPWNRTDEPGMSVGVVRDGALLYRRAFGMASLETGAANTPATRMRIGSISKHFTAMLALLLAEEGRLDLDQPIRAYLPELTGPGGEPTLRLLLQHRGGSRCYLDLGFIGHGTNAPPPGTALATQARQQGSNFAPGAAMIYNNGGYNLVSLAIERVGGAPFEAQLKARIFDVVGMPDTASIPSDHDITPGMATMHTLARDGRWRRGLFPSEELRGEGAMVSTLDDMLRWTAHLRRRDRLGSAASWAQLTELPRAADGASGVYALGLLICDYRGLKTVQHSGGVIGGSAQMLTLPEDGLDVVILVNGARGADPGRLSEQVVDIVLADRVGAERPTIAADDHAEALGEYWSPQNGMVYTLRNEKGTLTLGLAKAPGGLPLVPGDDGWLVSPARSLGELRIRPSATADAMDVVFGGETLTHERLRVQAGDSDAFAAAAVGRYASDDAATTAEIEGQGSELTLSLSDGFGRTTSPLTALSPRVAFSRPQPPMNVFRTTLSLDLDGGRARGFTMNTVRTRGLAFRRV